MNRLNFLLCCLTLAIIHGDAAFCQETDGTPTIELHLIERGSLKEVEDLSFRPRRKFAICVGINAPSDKSYTSLNHAGDDAIEFARCLLLDCRFDVVLLATDALIPEEVRKEVPTLEVTSKISRADIRDAAEKMFSAATCRDDIVVFYFAGHGNAEDYGPFLVAEDKPLLLSTVFDFMFQPPAQAQNRMIVLDACRSSPVDASGRVLSPSFLRMLGLEQSRSVIWCGCGDQQNSKEDGLLKHGWFTWTLLEAMRGAAFREGEERLSVTDVADFIERTFEEKGWAARQTPRLLTAHQFVLAQRNLPKPLALSSFEMKQLAEMEQTADDHYRRSELEKARDFYRLCLRVVDSRLTEQKDEEVGRIHGRLLAKQVRVLYRLRLLQDSLPILEQARKLAPDDAALVEYDAYRLLELGKLPDARKQFERILPDKLPLSTASPFLWSQYGLLLYRLKNYSLASQAFATSTALFVEMQQPGDAAVQLNRAATCLAKAGDHSKAYEQLRKSVELLKESGKSLKTLEEADLLDGFTAYLQSTGKFSDALQIGRLAFNTRKTAYGDQFSDGLAAAHNQMANVCLDCGEREQARTEIESALNLVGGSEGKSLVVADCLLVLGQIHLSDGNVEAAIEQLSKSLAIREQLFDLDDKHILPALDRLAETYKLAGKLDAYRQVNERIVHISEGSATRQYHPEARTFALLVGINDYSGAGIPSLRYSERDAKAIAAAFGNENIQTELITGNVTGDALRKRVLNLKARIGPDDSVVVFYSGHGSAVRDRSFLFPSDADPDRPDTLIPIDELFEAFKMSNHVTYFVDARIAANSPVPVPAQSGFDIQHLKLPENVAVLASCASIEAENHQAGVFTRALIDGLSGEAIDDNGEITVAGVGAYIGRVSEDYARKTGSKVEPSAFAGTSKQLLWPIRPRKQASTIRQVVEKVAEGICGLKHDFASLDVRFAGQFPDSSEMMVRADVLAACKSCGCLPNQKSPETLVLVFRTGSSVQREVGGLDLFCDITVRDEKGRVTAQSNIGPLLLNAREALVLLAGATDLPSPIANIETVQQLQEVLAVGGKSAVIDGNRMKGGEYGKVSMELIAFDKPGQESTPIPPKMIDKTITLQVNPMIRYGIRVRNDEEFDIAVDVSVNGIRLTHFVVDPHRDSALVIPKQTEYVFHGWYRTREQMWELTLPLEFPANASSGSLPPYAGTRNNGEGTIQLTYRAMWESGARLVDEEQGVVSQSSIGIGSPNSVEPTSVQPQVGELRGSIAVNWAVKSGTD